MIWNLGAGLEGKGIVVTGAAGGIGRAVSEAFASAGAHIMAVDLELERAAEVVGALEGAGHVGVGLDLSDLEGHRALLARAQRELGNVYVLAHTAALLRRRPTVDDVTEDDWDAQMDTNLKASFFLCREAATVMKAGGMGGRIIALTSQAWWTGGFDGSAVYAASKGGLVSMLRSMARSYGADNITVNTVAPGFVNTPMLNAGLDAASLRAMSEATPLQRVAEPEEIAGIVVFLASRHADFVTGATINATGGFLMY